MVGIAKQCHLCHNQFITRSARSASWENKCHECSAVYKKDLFSKELNNQFAKITSRVEKVEQMIDTIPMLVAAEISNSLGQVTEIEMLKVIKEELNIKIEAKQLQREEKLKAFQAKIQKQILTLNNKIINILKEMN